MLPLLSLQAVNLPASHVEKYLRLVQDHVLAGCAPPRELEEYQQTLKGLASTLSTGSPRDICPPTGYEPIMGDGNPGELGLCMFCDGAQCSDMRGALATAILTRPG